jgi:hypothetical protein
MNPNHLACLTLCLRSVSAFTEGTNFTHVETASASLLVCLLLLLLS